MNFCFFIKSKKDFILIFIKDSFWEEKFHYIFWNKPSIIIIYQTFCVHKKTFQFNFRAFYSCCHVTDRNRVHEKRFAVCEKGKLKKFFLLLLSHVNLVVQCLKLLRNLPKLGTYLHPQSVGEMSNVDDSDELLLPRILNNFYYRVIYF